MCDVGWSKDQGERSPTVDLGLETAQRRLRWNRTVGLTNCYSTGADLWCLSTRSATWQRRARKLDVATISLAVLCVFQAMKRGAKQKALTVAGQRMEEQTRQVVSCGRIVVGLDCGSGGERFQSDVIERGSLGGPTLPAPTSTRHE